MAESQQLYKTGAVIYTGGSDRSGRPLVTFPPQHLHLLTSPAAIVMVIQHLFTLMPAAGAAAFVTSFRTCTKEMLQALVTALDDLQTEKPGTVGVFYAVLPKNRDLQKQLKKLLGLKPSKKNPKTQLFQIVLVSDVKELSQHIDLTQLTSDVGGTMQYQHQSLVTFQQDHTDFKAGVAELTKKIPGALDKLGLMLEYDIPGDSAEAQALVLAIRNKYHTVMRELNIEHTIDECKEYLEKLKAPQNGVHIPESLRKQASEDIEKTEKHLIGQWTELKLLWQQAEARVLKRSKVMKYKGKADKVLQWIDDVGMKTVNQDPEIADCLSQAEIFKNAFETGFYSIAKNVVWLSRKIQHKLDDLALENKAIAPDLLKFSAKFQSTVDYFKKAVDKKLQVYVNVHSFFLTGQKDTNAEITLESGLSLYTFIEQMTGWYHRCLKFLPIQLLHQQTIATSAGQQKVVIRPTKAWRSAVDNFLLHHPMPKVMHLSKLKNVLPVIDDLVVRHQARLLIHRIEVLCRLFGQTDGTALGVVKQAVRWRDQVAAGADDITLNMAKSSTTPLTSASLVQFQPDFAPQFPAISLGSMSRLSHASSRNSLGHPQFTLHEINYEDARETEDEEEEDHFYSGRKSRNRSPGPKTARFARERSVPRQLRQQSNVTDHKRESSVPRSLERNKLRSRSERKIAANDTRKLQKPPVVAMATEGEVPKKTAVVIPKLDLSFIDGRNRAQNTEENDEEEDFGIYGDSDVDEDTSDAAVVTQSPGEERYISLSLPPEQHLELDASKQPEASPAFSRMDSVTDSGITHTHTGTDTSALSLNTMGLSPQRVDPVANQVSAHLLFSKSLPDLNYRSDGGLDFTQNNIDTIVGSCLPEEDKLDIMTAMCQAHNISASKIADISKGYLHSFSDDDENEGKAPQTSSNSPRRKPSLPKTPPPAATQQSSSNCRLSLDTVDAQPHKLTNGRHVTSQQHVKSPNAHLNGKERTNSQEYKVSPSKPIRSKDNKQVLRFQENHVVINSNQSMVNNPDNHSKRKHSRDSLTSNPSVKSSEDHVTSTQESHVTSYKPIKTQVAKKPSRGKKKEDYGIDVAAWVNKYQYDVDSLQSDSVGLGSIEVNSADGMDECVQKLKEAKVQRKSAEDELEAEQRRMAELELEEESFCQQEVERSLNRTDRMLKEQEQLLRQDELAPAGSPAKPGVGTGVTTYDCSASEESGVFTHNSNDSRFRYSESGSELRLRMNIVPSQHHQTVMSSDGSKQLAAPSSGWMENHADKNAVVESTIVPQTSQDKYKPPVSNGVIQKLKATDNSDANKDKMAFSCNGAISNKTLENHGNPTKRTVVISDGETKNKIILVAPQASDSQSNVVPQNLVKSNSEQTFQRTTRPKMGVKARHLDFRDRINQHVDEIITESTAKEHKSSPRSTETQKLKPRMQKSLSIESSTSGGDLPGSSVSNSKEEEEADSGKTGDGGFRLGEEDIVITGLDEDFLLANSTQKEKGSSSDLVTDLSVDNENDNSLPIDNADVAHDSSAARGRQDSVDSTHHNGTTNREELNKTPEIEYLSEGELYYESDDSEFDQMASTMNSNSVQNEQMLSTMNSDAQHCNSTITSNGTNAESTLHSDDQTECFSTLTSNEGPDSVFASTLNSDVHVIAYPDRNSKVITTDGYKNTGVVAPLTLKNGDLTASAGATKKDVVTHVTNDANGATYDSDTDSDSGAIDAVKQCSSAHSSQQSPNESEQEEVHDRGGGPSDRESLTDAEGTITQVESDEEFVHDDVAVGINNETYIVEPVNESATASVCDEIACVDHEERGVHLEEAGAPQDVPAPPAVHENGFVRKWRSRDMLQTYTDSENDQEAGKTAPKETELKKKRAFFGLFGNKNKDKKEKESKKKIIPKKPPRKNKAPAAVTTATEEGQNGGMICARVHRAVESHYLSTEALNLLPPIIIDCGSGMCKAGLATNPTPTHIFPSIIGRTNYEEAMHGHKNQEVYLGEAAQTKREVLKITYPQENGIVKDWNDMEMIWHHALVDRLGADPEEHPLLLTASPLTPARDRERLATVMFESIRAPALYVGARPALAVVATGKRTGVVVDIGASESHVVPVYECCCLPHATTRLNLAGSDLTDYLAKLLHESGDFSPLTPAARDAVCEMKEQHCYVAASFFAESVTAATTGRLDQLHRTPDGRSVALNSHRFRVGEALFQPGLLGRDHGGLHHAVRDAVSRCLPDSQTHMLNNILLSGGTTLLPGLPSRLKSELSSLYSDVVPPPQITVHSPDRQDLLVWQGGATLATQESFDSNWIFRQDYDEYGVNIVHKKCF